MSIEYLISLFDLHQIMLVVAALLVVNMAITGFEVCLDLATKKERRWKDTLANCAIFVAHQVIEKTAIASLGFVALLPFFYVTPLFIPMTVWTWVLALLAAGFYLLLDASIRASAPRPLGQPQRASQFSRLQSDRGFSAERS